MIWLSHPPERNFGKQQMKMGYCQDFVFVMWIVFLQDFKFFALIPSL